MLATVVITLMMVVVVLTVMPLLTKHVMMRMLND